MPRAESRPVVVVEDDASVSQALERILRLGGYATVGYSSAEALLEGDVAMDAACLILDIHLPGLSGFELHQRLFEKGATAPVIFITAFDEAEARARAYAIHAAAYLAKPFSGRTLLENVRSAIGASVVGHSNLVM